MFVARTLASLLEVASQCAKEGLVHRDIKPQNCFVGADKLVRLGDFGIARNVDEATWLGEGTPIR
jgi:serine/threonine protein kinase